MMVSKNKSVLEMELKSAIAALQQEYNAYKKAKVNVINNTYVGADGQFYVVGDTSILCEKVEEHATKCTELNLHISDLRAKLKKTVAKLPVVDLTYLSRDDAVETVIECLQGGATVEIKNCSRNDANYIRAHVNKILRLESKACVMHQSNKTLIATFNIAKK